MSSFTKLDDYISDLQKINASPTDTFLCKLATTELLCHTIDQELCLSNPAQVVSTPSPKSIAIIQPIQARIDSLDLGQSRQFEKCRFFGSRPSDHLRYRGLTNFRGLALFEFGRLASSLYMNELALHVNNNIDEFKAPFFARSLKTCNFLDNQDPSHLSMIRAIVIASQGLLNIFLGFSIPDMLTLPPHIYGGRVIYAVILLMKIHKAITLSGKGIGEITQAGDLGLEAYLERLIVTSKYLRTQDERSPLSRAFMIMPQLVEQFKKSHKPEGDTTMNKSPSKTGHEQLNLASPFLGAVSGDRFTTLRATGNDSIPGNSGSLDETTSQMDGLVQSAIPPYPPPTHSEDINFGAGPSIAPDTWFWEFFNTDMLN